MIMSPSCRMCRAVKAPAPVKAATFDCFACRAMFVSRSDLQSHLATSTSCCKRSAGPKALTKTGGCGGVVVKGSNTYVTGRCAGDLVKGMNSVFISQGFAAPGECVSMDSFALSNYPSILSLGRPGTQTFVKAEVIQREAVVVEKKVQRILNKQVQVCCDASGSMSGAPYSEAMNGLRSILLGLNVDHDWFGLSVFGTTVRRVVNPVFLKTAPSNAKYASKRDEINAEISGLMTAGANLGGTALYDAVAEAANAFRRAKKGVAVQYELVVLTDGADGSSRSYSKESVNALLKTLKSSTDGLPMLHVTVLAVGMSASDRALMQGMVAGVGEVVDVSARAGSIHDSFVTTVRKGIEMREKRANVYFAA